MNCTCVCKPGDVVEIDSIDNPICPKCGLRLFGEEIKMCFFEKIWENHIRYVLISLAFIFIVGLASIFIVGIAMGLIVGLIWVTFITITHGHYWILWILGIPVGFLILREVGKCILDSL